MSKETCTGCGYYRKIGAGGRDRGCHYCHDTGNPRNCPAENCNKKITRKSMFRTLFNNNISHMEEI